MADTTATTWRVVGIAYATVAHMNSYVDNKDSGMPRFVVEEGTEYEMKDRFSVLKRICPVIELYDNNGVVERHDEILDACAKSTFPERTPDYQSAMYTRIGKLMFRI